MIKAPTIDKVDRPYNIIIIVSLDGLRHHFFPVRDKIHLNTQSDPDIVASRAPNRMIYLHIDQGGELIMLAKAYLMDSNLIGPVEITVYPILSIAVFPMGQRMHVIIQQN
jgi:hypothetical protein